MAPCAQGVLNNQGTGHINTQISAPTCSPFITAPQLHSHCLREAEGEREPRIPWDIVGLEAQLENKHPCKVGSATVRSFVQYSPREGVRLARPVLGSAQASGKCQDLLICVNNSALQLSSTVFCAQGWQASVAFWTYRLALQH